MKERIRPLQRPLRRPAVSHGMTSLDKAATGASGFSNWEMSRKWNHPIYLEFEMAQEITTFTTP